MERVDTSSQPDHDAPRRSARSLTLATLCLAVLIVQADTSVVNLAMRPIGHYFHVGVSSQQWILDSYNLVYAALLLTGGLLADLLGRRRIFMAGAGLFTLASLLCALTPNVALLITGRAFSGLAAALMLPTSLALIRVVWPEPALRARAVGIWAGCNGLSLAIGPALGGLLTAWFGWRSIFLLAVPLGLAALSLAPLCIPESSNPEGRSFDFPGQILGALTLGGLALAVIESHRLPFLATGTGIATLFMLLLFIRLEARLSTRALVPVDLFRIPAFVSAMTATTGMTFGMYGVLFLLPLTWLATGQLDPVSAGVALMPMALIFVVVSPFSGAFVHRFGSRIATSGGVAVIGCGLWLIAASTLISSLAIAEIGLTLTGIGMGLATGPLMGAAVAAVSAARSGTASALINVARMVGATLGVAVLGAVFALAGGGIQGLCVAMLLGGAVQLSAAIAAWHR